MFLAAARRAAAASSSSSRRATAAHHLAKALEHLQQPSRPAARKQQQHRYITHHRSIMSSIVLRASENLPGMSGPAAAEPPSKQPRLDEQQAACSFRVKLLNEHATPPKRGSTGAAGYDLASAEDCVIPARGKRAVKTGLAIHVPHGTYGRVAPRSGLAAKHFIDTGAGVIDEDYRGEVLVLLFNHSDADFQVAKGDRIAQLVLERIVTPEVEVVEDLDDTHRGAGGFGSTGGFGGAPAAK